MRFLLLLLSMLLVSQLQAQGHYDGQVSLGIHAGLENNNTKVININVQKLFKGNYFGLRADLLYSRVNKELTVIVPTQMPLSTYNIGLAGLYSFEKFIKYPFYINVFLGGNYGYENLHNSTNTSDQGVTFQEPQTNVLGGYAGAELEYMFTKSLSLAISSINQYQFNSDFDKARYIGTLGIKFNF